MDDWLDPLEAIEEEKKRKYREMDEERERSRPEREAREARNEAIYQRNKEAINRTFDGIASYVERANRLADAKLVCERKELECKISEGECKLIDNKVNRAVKVKVHKGDDYFTLDVKYVIPSKFGDPYSMLKERTFEFNVPINNVKQEHIMEWAKWVAKGEGAPSYWRDISGGKETTYRVPPGGCLYSPTTYIVIGIVLVLIFLLLNK